MKKKELIKNVIENKRVAAGPDYRDMVAILLFIFLFPYIVSFFFGNTGKGEISSVEGEAQEETVTEAELFRENYEEAEYIICNTTAAGTQRIPLESYLVGRLPGTIDMDCDIEVLKAQAVVLRTELIRSWEEDAGSRQGDESFGERGSAEGRDNSADKHYIYVESDLPKVSVQNYEQSKEAVESTKGMYMTCGGKAITAPYFSVSAGKTRNGNEAFHSEEYPYLQSVVCDRDFTSSYYLQTVEVKKQVFYECLWELLGEEKETWKEKERQGIYDKALADSVEIYRDSAGYVTEVSFEGRYISGEGVRAAFALNSSCFEWEEEHNTVIIHVKGVGHGLGLCHYGANEAAEKGSDYIDILNYFFTDIVIEKSY